MSVRTKRVEPYLQLDSGLIIPTGAAAGYVLASDSSGNASWAAPSLLKSLAYAGATDGSYTTMTTSMAALDTTNLRLVVVAPPSGNVLLRFTGAFSCNGSANIYAGFMNGASNVGSGLMVNTPGVATFGVTRAVKITGLTPGTSYDFDAGWYASSTDGLSFSLFHGPTYGAIALEAYSA